MAKIFLEGSLRAPDYSLSKPSTTILETTKPFRTSSGIPYGTAPHLKALWNQNIGRNTRIGGFFGSVGYVLGAKNQILIPKKKKDYYVPPYLRY